MLFFLMISVRFCAFSDLLSQTHIVWTWNKALSQPFRLHWFAVLALILGAWMAGFGYGARAALKDARQECCDRHRQGLPACGEAAP